MYGTTGLAREGAAPSDATASAPTGASRVRTAVAVTVALLAAVAVADVAARAARSVSADTASALAWSGPLDAAVPAPDADAAGATGATGAAGVGATAGMEGAASSIEPNFGNTTWIDDLGAAEMEGDALNANGTVGSGDDAQVIEGDLNGTLQGVTGSLTKSTWPVSDTHAALEWMLEYLPTITADDSCTNGTCTCGSQGRTSMAGSGFGLHAVNTSQSHCTNDAMTVPHAESIFSEKLRGMDKFDAFLDYCAGFWAPGSLDRWAEQFERGAQPFLVLTWVANCTECAAQQKFYSLMVRIPETMVVVELVATSCNLTMVQELEYGSIAQAPLQRVGSETLASFISEAATDRLSPLKLSRASTNPERDVAFYRKLGCEETEVLRSADGKHAMRSITWEPPEDVELQFWWHADSETAGATKVSHFESGVRAVHDACVSSYHCGFDQWMDHHYAYDGVAELDHFVTILDSFNVTYSLWQQAFTADSAVPVTLYTLYFADETGLAVQLDGTLTNPPPYIPMWSDELCGDGQNCTIS